MRILTRILISLAAISAYSQTAMFSSQNVVQVTVSPFFISFNAGGSTETNAMGSRTNTTCAANAYCTQTVDKTVGGETILVFYTYKNASSQPPTVTDDKSGGSSTYTCITEAHDGSTNQSYAGACYVLNAAANIRNITVTWPVATATQGSVSVGLFGNAPTFDVSTNNGTEVATTSFSAGSMTTTAANDLVCQYAVGTTTRTDVTAWTAGAGLTTLSGQSTQMQSADRREAQAVQCGIKAASGSITPTITGQSNGYVSVAVSFKPSTSGTAQSGLYISHIWHYNSANGTGNPVLQVPTQGNLLVAQLSSGGTTPRTVSSISDGTNTYTQCGSANTSAANDPSSQTFYAANLTAGLLAVTVTTSGTGDTGPIMFYDVSGAATTQLCQRTFGNSTSSPPAGNFTPFTSNSHFGSTNAIAFGMMGINTNTCLSASSPSGALFDLNTNGGETIDGPYPNDQNNCGAHLKGTDNTKMTWTWNMSNGAETIGAWAAEVDSFQGSGATLLPFVVASGNNQLGSTGTTIAVTIPSTQSGDSLVIVANNNSSQSITKVCTDGSTCAAGNSFTQVSSGQCSNSTSRGGAWYLFNAPAGTTTVTVTYGGTSANREAMVWEVSGISATDGSSVSNTQTVSSSTASAPSLTTTGTNGFVIADFVVSNVVSANPKSGNEFVDGGVIWGTTTDSANSLVSTSAAAHQSQVTDASGTYCSLAAAFK